MRAKLKPFLIILLGATLILNLLTSTVEALDNANGGNSEVNEAAEQTAQYIKLTQTTTATSEQLDIQVTFTPYLSEAIRIPVPENLIYNEDGQILQGENRVYLDAIKNEVVIQPPAKEEAKSTELGDGVAIDNLSDKLAKPREMIEQAVTLQFKATVNGEYHLQATSLYEGSDVKSNELNVALTVPVKEIEEASKEVEAGIVNDSATGNVQSQETTTKLEKTGDIATRDITITDNVADVTDWTGFRTAIRNPDINVINIMNDIENDAGTVSYYNDTQVTGYSITRDLEINGNGHRMNFKGTSMRVGTPPTGTTPTFHLHDFSYLNQDGSPEDLVGSGGWTGGYNVIAGRWKWRFGNIVTSKSTNSASVGIRRIARVATGEVTLYGNNDIQTQGENFYAGSFVIEPGARWKGTVTYYNYSVVWYQESSPATASGATGEFTVGANANVQLTHTVAAATAYPAIFEHFKDMTIGENAVFNVGMPGTAVRFNDANTSMTVKKGAIINLTSTSKGTAGTNYAAVSFSNNTSTFKAEKGSFIYIIGNSTQPLVNMSATGFGDGNWSRTGNKFILDSPAQYDIRNIRDGNYPALQVHYGNAAANELNILNSDIDMWNLNTAILGPSSLTYALVENLSVTGGGTLQKATSTNTELASNFKSASYRRISGMNQDPTVEFDSTITDAHLTIKARVKIGDVPDNNGADINGDVKYIPVYASTNQATASITDTFGVVHADLPTDVNGYVQYTDTIFNTAGKEITASATRGPWLSATDGKTTVVDVTPPNPAELLDPVRLTASVIKGINAEPGATIVYTVNGVEAMKDGAIISSVVKPDGTWELAVPSTKLVLGDKVQFFLTDSTGNKNPETPKSLYDAIFPEGTSVIVQDGQLKFLSAPTAISFGDEMLIAAKATSYPIVSMDGKLAVEDTRQVKASWTLTAKMNQVLTSSETSKTLPEAMRYTKDGVAKVLGTASILIYENTNTNEDPLLISDSWIPNGDGLSLNVKPGEAYSETYEGEIEWTLQDTP